MSTATVTLPQPVAPRAVEKRARLDSLQVCRGCAALLVGLHHAGTFANGHPGGPFLGGAMDWGAAGVDFFFVLSGFIIFFVHRRDLGCPASLGAFAVKRLVRIYPIYWVACVVVIPLYFLFPGSGPAYTHDPAAILTSVLLVPQAHFPILAQAWTLTYEMLFYALFAGLIWRFRLFVVPAVAWMAVCAGIYFFELLTRSSVLGDPPASFGFPWNWLFSRHNLLFGFGVGTAVLVMRGVSVRWCRVSQAVGVGLFVGFAALNQPGSPFDLVKRLDYPLTFGVASALVVIGAAGLDVALPTLRTPGILLYLGNASYSIYLFHSIAMSILVRPAARVVAHGLSVNATCLLMCAAAVGVGCLAHSLVEQPLLNLLRRRLVARAS